MCDVEPFDWDVWPFTELDVEGIELMMFNTKKDRSTRKRWTSWLNGVKGRAVQKTNNFNFGLTHAVTRYSRPVTSNLALNFNFFGPLLVHTSLRIDSKCRFRTHNGVSILYKGIQLFCCFLLLSRPHITAHVRVG